MSLWIPNQIKSAIYSLKSKQLNDHKRLIRESRFSNILIIEDVYMQIWSQRWLLKQYHSYNVYYRNDFFGRFNIDGKLYNIKTLIYVRMNTLYELYICWTLFAE